MRTAKSFLDLERQAQPSAQPANITVHDGPCLPLTPADADYQRMLGKVTGKVYKINNNLTEIQHLINAASKKESSQNTFDKL